MSPVGEEYFESFRALRAIVLEDSWVLDIAPQSKGCRFRLDAVLTPEHPLYHPPRAGESNCYMPAVLELSSTHPVSYEATTAQPATDATGHRDWGNIDSFSPASAGESSGTTWRLLGDWGSLLIQDPMVVLVWDSVPPPT
jgi:hypothetical protein